MQKNKKKMHSDKWTNNVFFIHVSFYNHEPKHKPAYVHISGKCFMCDF